MPGNEIETLRVLFSNVNKISINHLGVVKELGIPVDGVGRLCPVTSMEDVQRCSSDDSRKKADIYINGKGVSIKQEGGYNAYNRLQRCDIVDVSKRVGIADAQGLVLKLDRMIEQRNAGLLRHRNVPWTKFLEEAEFKALLKYLMMIGSPNNGGSLHPAQYILVSNVRNPAQPSFLVYSFDEYFEKYKNRIVFALRCCWIGQKSKSEGKRAKGLVSKPDNLPWVFHSFPYKPKAWDKITPPGQRRIVYTVFLEVLR